MILWSKTYSRKFKFAMHDAFLCEFNVCRYFAWILNSWVVKFANISENKVLTNISEFTVYYFYLSHCMTKPTKWQVWPAKTQISLGISPVRSESLLCAFWVAKDPMFLHADSELDWADPSLRWAHRSFCWFCHAAARLNPSVSHSLLGHFVKSR